MAGASFKLKDAEGNTVTQTIYYPKKQTLDTFTTDESGCVTLPEEVGWGLYTIEEIASPKGYLIRTESLPVFVGKTGDTADQVYELDIEIPNEAVMGQIRLEKKGLQLVGFETQTEMGFEYQSPIFEERALRMLFLKYAPRKKSSAVTVQFGIKKMSWWIPSRPAERAQIGRRSCRWVSTS